jgi:hypothetical protein
MRLDEQIEDNDNFIQCAEVTWLEREWEKSLCKDGTILGNITGSDDCVTNWSRAAGRSCLHRISFACSNILRCLVLEVIDAAQPQFKGKNISAFKQIQHLNWGYNPFMLEEIGVRRLRRRHLGANLILPLKARPRAESFYSHGVKGCCLSSPISIDCKTANNCWQRLLGRRIINVFELWSSWSTPGACVLQLIYAGAASEEKASYPGLDLD